MMVFKSTGKSLILLCTILVLSCGSDVSLPPLSPDATVLAFGDSLTAGNGAPAEGSYPYRLSRLLGREVINAGVSGETSEEGRERLAGLLEQYNPELLILCHGGNDLMRKFSVTALGDNLRTMIAMAQERQIPVLLLGVPAPGIFLSSEDVFEEVAEETGVVFIPELISDVLSSPALKSDTVHPNEAGYTEIANTIFEELQKLDAI